METTRSRKPNARVPTRSIQTSSISMQQELETLTIPDYLGIEDDSGNTHTFRDVQINGCTVRVRLAGRGDEPELHAAIRLGGDAGLRRGGILGLEQAHGQSAAPLREAAPVAPTAFS